MTLLRHLMKASSIIILVSIIISASCSYKKGLLYSSNKVSSSAKIAVIIDSENNIKNAVLITFLKHGFKVKAVNSSDLYTIKDVYDISDMKKLSYNLADVDVSTVQKTYDNIYKLHIYNFELNKAEYLKQMRTEWDVEYLVLLDMKEWEKVSWARVINLRTFEIDFIENYPTAYNDNIQTITEHFIKSITGK
jgi:hypothetical protein